MKYSNGSFQLSAPTPLAVGKFPPRVLSSLPDPLITMGWAGRNYAPHSRGEPNPPSNNPSLCDPGRTHLVPSPPVPTVLRTHRIAHVTMPTFSALVIRPPGTRAPPGPRQGQGRTDMRTGETSRVFQPPLCSFANFPTPRHPPTHLGTSAHTHAIYRAAIRLRGCSQGMPLPGKSFAEGGRSCEVAVDVVNALNTFLHPPPLPWCPPQRAWSKRCSSHPSHTQCTTAMHTMHPKPTATVREHARRKGVVGHRSKKKITAQP